MNQEFEEVKVDSISKAQMQARPAIDIQGNDTSGLINSEAGPSL